MSDTHTNTTDIDTYDGSTDIETTREEHTNDGGLEVYDLQRHRNGDETVLLLCSFGNGYQAIAFDVDAGGQLLETETVGDSPDREKAVGMCEFWLQQNPDGVLGGEPESESFLEKLGFGGDGGGMGFGGDGT